MTAAEALRWSLIVARKGAGFVSPNPMVGCVIVDAAHRFVAAGYHHRLGQAHAEVDAVMNFEALKGHRQLAGYHVYVSLEPCSHQGRTGSCAVMMSELRPDSVTYLIRDPNPLVSGKGAEIIRQAGIATFSAGESDRLTQTQKSELIEDAEDLNEIFLWNMRTQSSPDARCFVTVKLATSLDGQVALRSGESQWITSDEAREKGHRLRLEHDAILVGRKTIETDNPTLNVRLRGVENFKNRVVILDPKAQLLPKLLEDGADEKFNVVRVRGWDQLIVAVQDQKIPLSLLARARDRGVRVLSGIGSEGLMDLSHLTRELRREGVRGLFVEGGAGTLGPFFDQNIVQRLHVFMAPMLIGGRDGISWSSQFGVSSLAQVWKMKRLRVKKLGEGDALNMHWTGRLDLELGE